MRSITKGWKIFGTEIRKKKPETLVFEMELGFWAGATVVMKILDEDGASPEVLARLCAEVRAYQHEMCDLRDAIMRNHYSNETNVWRKVTSPAREASDQEAEKPFH
jgi:hypothetical protein